jgi:hypothetical protein
MQKKALKSNFLAPSDSCTYIKKVKFKNRLNSKLRNYRGRLKFLYALKFYIYTIFENIIELEL